MPVSPFLACWEVQSRYEVSQCRSVATPTPLIDENAFKEEEITSIPISKSPPAFVSLRHCDICDTGQMNGGNLPIIAQWGVAKSG